MMTRTSAITASATPSQNATTGPDLSRGIIVSPTPSRNAAATTCIIWALAIALNGFTGTMPSRYAQTPWSLSWWADCTRWDASPAYCARILARASSVTYVPGATSLPSTTAIVTATASVNRKHTSVLIPMRPIRRTSPTPATAITRLNSTIGTAMNRRLWRKNLPTNSFRPPANRAVAAANPAPAFASASLNA
jgi:hypothetical protein